MAGAPNTANMGLQASQRPVGYLPQGTVADADLSNSENVTSVPPPLVTKSFGQTLVQQNAFESTQLVEVEFAGSTSQSGTVKGDVTRFRLEIPIESTDFISPSETYIKMQIQWLVADSTSQSNQFGCYEQRLFPRNCSPGPVYNTQIMVSMPTKLQVV